jgi:tryptophan synthase alpha chain
MFKKYGLHLIFLISPQTSEQRMRLADELSGGFLYAVSSAATTGKVTSFKAQVPYFKKIKKSKFRLPVLIGFGIKTNEDFETASKYAAGAIIGSAYIKAIEHSTNIAFTTSEFIKGIKNA